MRRSTLFRTPPHGLPAPIGAPPAGGEPPASQSSVLLGGLIALGVVCGARSLVAHGLIPAVDARTLWRLNRDDVAVWLGWTTAWLFLLGPARPSRARRGAVAFHGLTGLAMLLSLTDLGFLAATGNRLDLDLIGTFFADLTTLLPIALSELRPSHLLGFVLSLAAAAGGALWRPTGGLHGSRTAVAFLIGLVTTGAVAATPTAQPKAPLREMSQHLAEHLWEDAQQHLQDEEIPPDPADLEPLRLRPVPGSGPARRPPDIVLVILESTGADHTSLHRPELGTTPTLARLAAEGLAVSEMTAVVPHTSKALVSLLCGAAPRLDHHITEATPGGLPERCLPELLAEQGYRTAFFQTARADFEDRAALVHNFGFQRFRSAETLPEAGFAKVNYFGREDAAMLGAGLDWAAQEPDRPSFSTYLTLTSHHSYGTPPGWPTFEDPEGDPAAAKHLAGVNYVDSFLERLIEGHGRLGKLDNTLFVVVGDHGEGFGEHGRSQHDLVIYEEGLHVPAVLYGPGVLGDRRGWIEGARSQHDLLPTLLELVGLEVEAGRLEGTSLLHPVEADRALRHACWRSFRCLAERRGSEKFIDLYEDGPARVYDLAEDPAESEGWSPDDLAVRREALRAWRSRVNGRATARQAEALDAKQRPDDAPAVAAWEGGMELLGCATERPEALVGDGVWLSCRWRAARPLREAWRLEATLRVGGKEYVTVHRPLEGLLPTWEWRAGLSVEDTLRVRAPRGAPTGTGTISLRWIRPSGGEHRRLGESGALPVAQVRLERPSPARSPATATRSEADAASNLRAPVGPVHAAAITELP